MIMEVSSDQKKEVKIVSRGTTAEPAALEPKYYK